jgi:hypothetical protein
MLHSNYCQVARVQDAAQIKVTDVQYIRYREQEGAVAEAVAEGVAGPRGVQPSKDNHSITACSSSK